METIGVSGGGPHEREGCDIRAARRASVAACIWLLWLMTVADVLCCAQDARARVPWVCVIPVPSSAAVRDVVGCRARSRLRVVQVMPS